MKARHLERLCWGLLTAASIVLFEQVAELDLWVASVFHLGHGRFVAEGVPWVQALYLGIPWAGRLMFVLALLAALVPRWGGWSIGRPDWRAAVSLALVMFLGLGVLVHAALKDQWGRPRPHQLQLYQGTAPFVPALHRSALCDRNCSFVSGHAATGFALIAVGAFGTPRVRRRWLCIGLAGGAAIGLMRIAQGRHFVSDVVFAAIVMWGTALLLRDVWVRVMLLRRRSAAMKKPGRSRVPSRA